MGVEIERKFLVTGSGWKTDHPTLLRQGYLNTEKSRTVRVRLAGMQAFLTIKGTTDNLTRAEFEYPIPPEDAQALLTLCDSGLIEKHRHTISIDNVVWEVDEFIGENKGLVVAEVELTSEDQSITLPQWIGKEVSQDARYFNSALSQLPYSKWEA